MPRSLQEILDQSDELAKRFEDYEPTEADRRPVAPMHRARAAVLAKAKAEAELAGAVAEMRSSGYSWATIGSVVGTSGEAARQRYGDVPVQTAGQPRVVPSSRGFVATIDQDRVVGIDIVVVEDMVEGVVPERRGEDVVVVVEHYQAAAQGASRAHE